MAKSADAFRTISEVAEWLETPAHVLRFWESKFSQVKPVKRAGGRRYYRPADMKLLGGIKKLLHDDGMTIKGVQKLLREQGVAHVSALSMPLGDAADDVVVEASIVADKPIDEPAKAAEPAKTDEAPIETAPEPETPLTFTRHAAPEPEVEKVKEDPVSEDKSETVPELPSFTHLRSKDTPPKTTGDPALIPDPAPSADPAPPEPEPEPAKPRPAAVDVPDDFEDTVEADPGLLTRLSTLPRPISSKTAEQLKPLLAKLRDRASS
ncbi:MerR family transcriptional regulator [Roseovarius rhodophyticola]|uniref:MerR family transcriptional regulator n=1 Tax=Roseovarius rhodophyticola TaxID=3080827 RepID=A0ABZ2TI72_9RHOB|nr:MerR family transcriptional regulator [Roseovarius sp. W115]MDV2928042.1 MerR family transcriptional regulator [Roseovarius sp. W115]